ncbi:MAG: class I SAM-dependent methyltransferase [Endomicrobium sp.]|jgi:hypothetical protein|nr:class I SAM-dependent methyltransferase [Endomicrobium sp.]
MTKDYTKFIKSGVKRKHNRKLFLFIVFVIVLLCIKLIYSMFLGIQINTNFTNKNIVPFSNFPKSRFVLPQEYADIYEKHYLENRAGSTIVSSLSSKVEGWMHYMVAKTGGNKKTTLEIGAGTLNQIDYEEPGVYDIVEPYSFLYKNSHHIKNIRKTYNSIFEIPFTSTRYDRIISIAVLEHVLDLPDLVAYSAKLLVDGGGYFVREYQTRVVFFGNFRIVLLVQ